LRARAFLYPEAHSSVSAPLAVFAAMTVAVNYTVDENSDYSTNEDYGTYYYEVLVPVKNDEKSSDV
jgi:hypothetical protein